MSEEKTESNTGQTELTPEQQEQAMARYKEARKEYIKGLKAELNDLRVETEYHELHARIANAKLARFNSSYELASIKEQLKPGNNGNQKNGETTGTEPLPDSEVSDSDKDATGAK